MSEPKQPRTRIIISMPADAARRLAAFTPEELSTALGCGVLSVSIADADTIEQWKQSPNPYLKAAAAAAIEQDAEEYEKGKR